MIAVLFNKIKFKAVVINKNAITALIFFLIFGVVFAALYGIERGCSVETLAQPLSGRIILLDPGHGGIDAGATANGVVEKDVNLKIAALLQKYIEESGGVAVLTRNSDTNTADPNRASGVSQKMSDLKERKKDIEDFKADLFLSIHMNKFSQSKYKGAQVFYTQNSEESKVLGETLQQAIKDTVEDANTRKAKPSGSAIFVLKNNTVPSALVECGFLSNPEEAALLGSEEYQKRIAWGIYIGILRFFSR